jgi:hypothetical protein
MDWMEMVQERDRWRELVTGVMIFRIPYYRELLDTRIIVSFLESICSME